MPLCQSESFGEICSNMYLTALSGSPTNLTLLLAYSITPTTSRQFSNSRRQTSYAIANLKDGSVTYLKALSYAHEEDPRPLSTPRLRLLPKEKICFVTFPDLVIATFMDTSLSFEESVALKDAAKDRLIGTTTSGDSSLIMLAAHTGLLKLDINVSHIKSLAS